MCTNCNTTPHEAKRAELLANYRRASFEESGARQLFDHLRGHAGFDGQIKAMNLLSGLEAKTAQAMALYQAACEPTAYSTPEQKLSIRSLLNDVRIKHAEKLDGLLSLHALGLADASAVIMGLKLTINDRAGHLVFPEVLGYTVVAGEVVEAQYGVVGSAELVSVQQEAA